MDDHDFDGLEGIELKSAFRADLLESLRLELLGPEEPEEVLTEPPTLRYLVGRLAPTGTEVPPEEDEGNADASDDSDEAGGGASAPTVLAMNPSSIGLSVVVDPDVSEVVATVRWGRYEKEESGPEPDVDESDETSDEAEPTDDDQATGTRRTVWRRHPVEETVSISIDAPGETPVVDEVTVEHVVKELADGRRAVSVFLVNRREASDPMRPPVAEWLFQPGLELTGPGGAAVFGPRILLEGSLSDDRDLRSAELVYWNQPEYAVGHGCAADWDPPEKRTSISSVRTSMLPAYELPRVDPRDDAPGTLAMRALGGVGAEGVPGDELVEMLTPLREAYSAWIEELEDGLLVDLEEQVPHILKETAWEHLERCKMAAERIQEGIQLLAQDDLVRRAFCFANRAMALQRERSEISLARRRGREQPWPEVVAASWRPFQLAFILLNLAGTADRTHRDREIADLLWFPTGGGKTEAYLGLTAFTLAHRRTREPIDGHRNDGGVAVVMRYTLRLLTLQQFQRATTLMCACDHLRRTEGEWGGLPFSIGLWVGKSATPNAYSDPWRGEGAKQALERLEDGLRVRAGSPVQLVTCPWCGADLDHTNYRADDDRQQVFATCSDDECDYSPTGHTRGLPIHVVDDEVYRHTPSLIIATVDKFARMPWKGHVQALFGRVERHCQRHGFLSAAERGHAGSHKATSSAPAAEVTPTGPFEPPDLIIQDELHLISGPLGTLVGIYEAGVDLLCAPRIDGVRRVPKVIASTATIRSADDQVKSLFRRKLQIFPPQGLDSRDSWFGKEVPTSASDPGRLYVGINAPGKSVKTAIVRVYAAVLSRPQWLRENVDAEAADPYMTLVGYFNSLRELGGALRLNEDDVPGRIKSLNRRDANRWARRYLNEREELTSNKKAEQVPQVLAKLERVFTDEKPESGRYPVDTVLASNMISVGVDIDRLGLMVVTGQPKTTAEYIQATSRVGRRSPGLVATVYNWTRPRDLSHYERFRSYHQMLYRFVEPTSVTPFSSRARDRALDGLFAGLARLGDLDLTQESAADAFSAADAWIDEVIDWIADRAEAVSPEAGDGSLAEMTRQELRARRDQWAEAASQWDLCYSRWGMGNDPPDDRRFLIGSAEDDHDAPFEAPGSLREVEGEVHVYVPRKVLRDD